MWVSRTHGQVPCVCGSGSRDGAGGACKGTWGTWGPRSCRFLWGQGWKWTRTRPDRGERTHRCSEALATDQSPGTGWEEGLTAPEVLVLKVEAVLLLEQRRA